MKRSHLFPAVIAVILTLALALTACSGGEKSASRTAHMAVPNAAPMANDSSAAGEVGQVAMQAQASPAGQAHFSGGGQVYADENAKLIREARLMLQTTEFDTAVAALEQLVTEQKGYYQQAEVQGGGYYDANAARYGEYTVRIPKGVYDAFLNAAGSVGHVVSRSETTTDVGEAYFDAEARLKTQQVKQARLQALLEQAESMEDIVALETALADVEYQIEQFSTELRRYDGLVDYATIYVTLSEVLKIDENPGETASLGARIASAFAQGFVGFGEALERFAVWAAYHFIGLLLLAAVVVAAALVWRKIRRTRKKATVSDIPLAPIDPAQSQQETTKK